VYMACTRPDARCSLCAERLLLLSLVLLVLVLLLLLAGASGCQGQHVVP